MLRITADSSQAGIITGNRLLGASSQLILGERTEPRGDEKAPVKRPTA